MKPKLTRDSEQRINLTLLLSAIVFVNLLLTFLIEAVAVVVVYRFGLLERWFTEPHITSILLALALLSLFLGSLMTLFLGRFILKPINRIINAMNRLASGDFATRLHFNRRALKLKVTEELMDSFNSMAEALEKTELLRTDFINNFSHEFKTPITSIAGFAKLLKRGRLTEEEKKEYLDIIEEESLRLSSMATNVLDLSRVENQTILTDVTVFDLSEQIRNCVLLLESSWDKKHLDMVVDFDEYSICANEELLKQVWINLLSNAVKFAPEYGSVIVKIAEQADNITVSVTNTGSEISAEAAGRIFQKFYQADVSHASEGNGIGLAIVKRVVELHSGTVTAESHSGITTFTVTLPKSDLTI